MKNTHSKLLNHNNVLLKLESKYKENLSRFQQKNDIFIHVTAIPYHYLKQSATYKWKENHDL